jgi:phospholipase/carboxylesterase
VVNEIPETPASNLMNRIQHYWTTETESLGRVSQEVSEVEEGRISSATQAAQTLFTPIHYENNYAYPLIVWLHGPNDDERQLKRIMPFVSLRNYVGVSPRGTAAVDPDAAQNGYTWEQTEDHILLAESRVLAAVAHARQEMNIAPRRIFLAGFGCGGTMAFRIALNLPQMFAGALSLGGSFPTGFNPLAQLDSARSLKWLLSTGRESRRYPPERVCENLRLLYAAGMSISLRQYPCGDDLTTQMLGDVDRWIMEQLATPEMSSSGRPTPHAGGE